jgi:hypothetical protein
MAVPPELAVSNAYEIAALVAALERKGIQTQQKIMDEIARLKKGGDVEDERDTMKILAWLLLYRGRM